jgi:hypothetical protein
MDFGNHIILVAGYDCFRTDIFSFPFEDVCRNRIRRLLKQECRFATASTKFTKDYSLKFTLFDVTSGIVRCNEKLNRRRYWRVIQQYTPISASNHIKGPSGQDIFVNNPTGVLSILDIYQYIQEIGINAPQSIIELSFFTHGWMGGPVLVNSYDTQPHSDARDPNDKDGRRFKDFRSPNMTEGQIRAFKNAFHPSGIIWNWSCANAASCRDLLHQVLPQLPNNKLEKLSDSHEFLLTFSEERANDYFQVDNDFFPRPLSLSTRNIEIKKTLGEIKSYLQSRCNAAYSKQIALASGVKCFGALPGTYSSFETGTRLPLLVITKNNIQSENFVAQIDFYQNYLNMEIDPEGRGYGAFLPTQRE